MRYICVYDAARCDVSLSMMHSHSIYYRSIDTVILTITDHSYEEKAMWGWLKKRVKDMKHKNDNS
jgi:hypothetical protein